MKIYDLFFFYLLAEEYFSQGEALINQTYNKDHHQ